MALSGAAATARYPLRRVVCPFFKWHTRDSPAHTRRHRPGTSTSSGDPGMPAPARRAAAAPRPWRGSDRANVAQQVNPSAKKPKSSSVARLMLRNARPHQDMPNLHKITGGKIGSSVPATGDDDGTANFDSVTPKLPDEIEDKSTVRRVARCIGPIDIAAPWEAEYIPSVIVDRIWKRCDGRRPCSVSERNRPRPTVKPAPRRPQSA